MRLRRAILMGVTVAALTLGGCAERPDPAQEYVDEILRPTGAPSSLTPSDATGERTSVDGAWNIVLPDGNVPQPDAPIEDTQKISYHMPDESEIGLPGVTIMWVQDAGGSALEDSTTLEITLKVNPAVSDLVRSEIEWPSANVAVVTRWSEEVLMESGDTIQVETVVLTLEGPDGTLVAARAYSLEDELEGSSAWEALRTVRLGQG